MADILGSLAPSAGHLVHMPSHIYLRVGRWEDAAEANRKAAAADEDYIAQCHAQGLYPISYYLHNLHMGSFAAAMQGGSAEAIGLANKMAAKIPAEIGDEMPFWGNIFTSLPVLANVRFGKWEDVLKYPQPSGKLLASNAIWHFGQGLALIRTDKEDAANEHLAAIEKIAQDPALKDMKMGNNHAASIVAIAENALTGELAASARQWDKSVAALQKAVAAEDSLHYNEPEDWYLPMRHALGAVLLEAGRPADAEQVYRKDLEKHPKNGWALYGLAKSLRAQGEYDDAELVEAQFAMAWMHADVNIAASSF
jgi:tetratricopeptide (TPR) repeat protein